MIENASSHFSVDETFDTVANLAEITCPILIGEQTWKVGLSIIGGGSVWGQQSPVLEEIAVLDCERRHVIQKSMLFVENPI